MSVVERVRNTPPCIVLTDCAFDFSIWSPLKHISFGFKKRQPITREMVEGFLEDPWAHLSPYDLARSWLELDDRLGNVTEDRDWWEAEGRAQARNYEGQRQRAAILTDRLESHLEKAHLEP